MYSVKMTGLDELKSGLNGVAEEIMRVPAFLDVAAGEIKGHMRDEAPEATGELIRSIRVFPPSPLRREIAPDAPHGFYQETRNYMSQKPPPVENIRRWAMIRGIKNANSAAFAIAKKIGATGYRANPFVQRTFEWAKNQMDKWFGQLANNISIAYQK